MIQAFALIAGYILSGVMLVVWFDADDESQYGGREGWSLALAKCWVIFVLIALWPACIAYLLVRIAFLIVSDWRMNRSPQWRIDGK